MQAITCAECGFENPTEPGLPNPSKCFRCKEDLVEATDPGADQTESGVAALLLIYQINQQSIRIPAAGLTVLGRDAAGASLLSNIFFNGKQVISRNHCSIEFSNNRFYLRDANSTNGTFYGFEKVDCKGERQVINDGDLIYLGEEPFLARIESETPAQRYLAEETAAEERLQVAQYRCNDPNCIPPYETQNPPKICPNCGTFDRFVLIARN